MENKKMKLFKYLLPIVLVATSMLFSAGQDDFEVVKDFVESKGKVSLAKKDVDLTLSGDLRVEYQHIKEKIGGVKMRGSGAVIPGTTITVQPAPATNNFDAEFNFIVDYASENAWAKVHMKYDNNLGIFSGSDNAIEMKTALVGYRLFDDDKSILQIQAGRTPGCDMFESEVQFDNKFDGLWLRYDYAFEGMTEFYLQGGPCLVDDSANHFLWIIEVGLGAIVDTGLYFKYSCIDWSKSGNTYYIGSAASGSTTGTVPAGYAKDRIRYHYKTSQFTLGYVFSPEVLAKDVKAYGAYGFNSSAKRLAITNNQKANTFWYAGVTLGNIKQANDWAMLIRYESVEAQAIQQSDISGIGNGNINGEILYDASTVADARGYGNYKGMALEAGYAVTDNLVLVAKYKSSKPKRKKIGGTHTYNLFEGEVVYAF